MGLLASPPSIQSACQAKERQKGKPTVAFITDQKSNALTFAGIPFKLGTCIPFKTDRTAREGQKEAKGEES